MEYIEEKDLQISIKQEFVEKLKKLKEEMDRYTKAYKELSKAIESELAPLHIESTCNLGDFNYVVKGGDYLYKFDEEKLKEEMPEIYAKYCYPTLSKVSAYIQIGKRGTK